MPPHIGVSHALFLLEVCKRCSGLADKMNSISKRRAGGWNKNGKSFPKVGTSSNKANSQDTLPKSCSVWINIEFVKKGPHRISHFLTTCSY